jgi:hypothetical protein
VHLDPGTLHRVAAESGTTLNDIFIADLLRGLSIYHVSHDGRAGHLRAVMPISTRRPSDPVESDRFVPVRLGLPADLPIDLRRIPCEPKSLGTQSEPGGVWRTTRALLHEGL